MTQDFRVWNGMEMVYDVTVGKFGAFYVNPGDKGNGLDPNDSASLTPFNTKYSDETPVMQFTGLKDMNGKKIYKGDVVRILYTDWASQTPDENGNYPMSLEDYKKSKSAIGYVDWDDHSTGWVIMTKSKYSVNEEGTVMTSIIHGTHGEREVIGHIYQTPSLLQSAAGV